MAAPSTTSGAMPASTSAVAAAPSPITPAHGSVPPPWDTPRPMGSPSPSHGSEPPSSPSPSPAVAPTPTPAAPMYTESSEDEGDMSELTEVEDVGRGRGGGAPRRRQKHPPTGNGTKVSDDERLKLASFACEHAVDYRTKTRREFNAILSAYCATAFDKTISDPHAVLRRAMKTLAAKEAKRTRATGAEIQVTALDQAIARWREVEASREQERQQQTQTRNDAAADERAVANEMRAVMVASPVDRRRSREAQTFSAALLGNVVKVFEKSVAMREKRRQAKEDDRRVLELNQLRLRDIESAQAEVKRQLEVLASSNQSLEVKLHQEREERRQEMRQQTEMLEELVGMMRPRKLPQERAQMAPVSQMAPAQPLLFQPQQGRQWLSREDDVAREIFRLEHPSLYRRQ